ncbi:hydrogenase maturation protease [Herbaspirillum sp. HC18]|nr:hydrogenase maturation protease [Herbaspirillum sp. HC18]
MRAPTLIIGYGNPSRGDDALGPIAIGEIERRMADHPEWRKIEILTDFQLQIEFVTDLSGRERIVFIDALASGDDAFSFARIEHRQDGSVTTHALSPAGLLAVYRSYHGDEPPPVFLLGIRGYRFDLGKPLSPGARSNLDEAVDMLERWLVS